MSNTPLSEGDGTNEPATLRLDPALLAELKRIRLRSRRTLDTDLMGAYRSAFRGSGLTFADLREYQPGDDIRHIHWKVTARTKQPFIKTFEEDRQLSVVLAIDISRSMQFGTPKTKHEKALEFASLLATLASGNGDLLSLCLFADGVVEFIPPRSSRRQLEIVLASILKHRLLPTQTDLASTLTYLRTHVRKSSVVFVVSDFLASDYEQPLRALSHRHDVILCNFVDDQEAKLPQLGLVEFLDPETGVRQTVNTSSRTATEHLSRSLLEHGKQAQELARLTGSDYLQVTNELLSPLHQLMRRRVRRIR